ncbi:MAG TPA: flavin reductase family protein [Gaiellaceae bacterium]|nr:flavin reductase family protein [Gaiellaceae bacterium]
MSTPAQLREVLRRVPTGVAVVTVESRGQRIGLTVATLVSLSLEPPLVGVAIARQAAIHELLREAGACAFSLLAADQQSLAEHFARGVPPIGMWDGIATRLGKLGAPLLEGALGWLECRLADELATGTHTFFVCQVVDATTERRDVPPLVRLDGGYLQT